MSKNTKIRNAQPGDGKDVIAEVRASVHELANRGGIGDARAFAAWYLNNFLDVDEDDALEAAALDGGEDQSIDLLYTDHGNERIVLLQSHYPTNPKRAAPKAKWDGLTSAIPWLENPEAFRNAGRPELASAAEEAKDHLDVYEILLGVVSFGAKSDQILRSLDTLKRSNLYKRYNFFYEAQTEILDGYQALKAGAKGIPEDTIQFDGGKWFEDKGEYGRAWIGSVPASELKRLYDTYGDKLFARNVRLFLGSRKGGINEQIIETAKTNPGKFWALNNGITIVADTVRKDGGKGSFRITRFRIVNGCQTTVSLGRAEAPEDAKVLTRLVAANDAVVGDIIRYNNTQNAVKIWTVRTADKLQERLRSTFSQISIDYAPKPEGGLSHKSNDVIQLDRLAQYLASQSSNTIVAAVKEKSELFDRYYQDIFPYDTVAEDVYLIWLLGIQADQERQERLATLKDQGDADKTLTALLAVAGTYWTVHCSYKFIQDLNSHPMRLLLRKMKSEQFKNALRKYVKRGLDTYIDIAIDTYDSDEYKSVRSALRSPKFLQKFDQKLANRSAGLKKDKKTLPQLGNVA